MLTQLVPAMLLAAAGCTKAEDLLTDITKISRSWGQMSTYADNPDNYFGVDHVGLPDGCQIESVSNLERHSQRFSVGGDDYRFSQKVANFTSENATAVFTGPLKFLNTYSYIANEEGLLTGIGATNSFRSGVSFWNRYGRTLYNASVAQLAYNASYPDGTARPPVVLRTTGQSRIWNSQINWALGFFGTSFISTPNPTLKGSAAAYEVVIIPEGSMGINNTLASYDSCFNAKDPIAGELGDINLFAYIPKYLGPATERLQQYAPAGFTFTVNDTYAMQSICAYEHAYIGNSDFCYFFTAEEWDGFENTLDMRFYYNYGYGNPTGRAEGIGYLQELLARLTHTPITYSNSSINSTLDSDPALFPLNQKFYADFSHDDITISVLAAMSMDYFKDAPTLTQFPPNPDRRFVMSHLTPFGATLITETIGCTVPDPEPVEKFRVQYTPGQYGYEPEKATYKFVRMRLNNGILPLDSIRGGKCVGRNDGLCELGAFVESQAEAYKLSNYDYACFGNWSVADPYSGEDYDGTIGINGTVAGNGTVV